MREFREMDRVAEERFFAQQRESQRKWMEYEERQAKEDRQARLEEAKNIREGNKEMAQMLATTIRQSFMAQPQAQPQPQFPQQVPQQPYNQNFAYQTPRRSSDNGFTPRTIRNLESGDITTMY